MFRTSDVNPAAERTEHLLIRCPALSTVRRASPGYRDVNDDDDDDDDDDDNGEDDDGEDDDGEDEDDDEHAVSSRILLSLHGTETYQSSASTLLPVDANAHHRTNSARNEARRNYATLFDGWEGGARIATPMKASCLTTASAVV